MGKIQSRFKGGITPFGSIAPFVSRLLYILAAVSLPLCRPDICNGGNTTIGAEESISIRGEVPPTEKPRLIWGKDPFVPLVSTGAETGAEAAAVLKLTAIFFNKDNPSAIINDRIVYVGSLIRGQKIIEIGKTHVILQNKESSIRLEFTGERGLSPRGGNSPSPEAGARK